MRIRRDQACITAEERGLAGLQPASVCPPMTPEAARRLAAILAPHLVAMRAVTAGTPYADRGDDATRGEMLSASSAPQISPATKIFIAGMLEHIQA